MPKISAPTVREHHERVRTAIVDAAEQILRTQGSDALTAAAVSERAGVARNSIYRYVDSVDDLRGMVIARYLPTWLKALGAALQGVDDPGERVLIWARVNLDQAATAGHGWLMRIGGRLDPATIDTVDAAHASLAGLLRMEWNRLAPERVDIAVALSSAMVDAGMRRIDAGDDPTATCEAVLVALRAMIERFAPAHDKGSIQES